MKKKDLFYQILILVVVIAFLVVTNFYLPVDPLSKKITTVTALISAVAFWLQFRRNERLNEANYIMNLNNQFISNKDMCRVEHELELYYNQYEILAKRNDIDIEQKISSIYFGIDLARTSEDCQHLINYLVYLEALAALVDRGVIHLNIIDDLFSYRFFLAVNNPVVQISELYPYADYYRGIYKLSERWTKIHRRKKIPIPLEQFSLTKENYLKWKNSINEESSLIPLDISMATSEDNKNEIAKCIYDTDRFIYPEAFGEDREEAAKIISQLIGIEDSLFDYKNILLARYNGQICGVCLTTDGKDTWNSHIIMKRISDILPSKERFEYVVKEYFQQFTENPMEKDTIELVACCVKEGFRNKKIADKMLRKLIENHSNKNIQLTVLSNNDAAITLYTNNKFEKKGPPEPGFAAEGLIKPICQKMILRRG